MTQEILPKLNKLPYGYRYGVSKLSNNLSAGIMVTIWYTPESNGTFFHPEIPVIFVTSEPDLSGSGRKYVTTAQEIIALANKAHQYLDGKLIQDTLIEEFNDQQKENS